MEFLVVSQARMTSTRLPGKVLLQVLGKSLLQYQIERVRSAKLPTRLVIATTKNKEDDPILELCERLKVDVVRGSEQDVLSRYWLASERFPTSHVVRITSDCPLIDPRVLDSSIHKYMDGSVDYLSNSEAYPNGMNVEIFSREMLREAFEKGQLPYEKEHVTPYFYTHPELFKLGQMTSARKYPRHRLTVDTPADFELIKTLIERLSLKNPDFNLDDICEEMERDPSLSEINAHIVQKKYNE